MSNSNKNTIKKLFKKAEENKTQFNYDLSIKFYQKILEIDPNNTEALDNIADLLLELGDPENAIKISFFIKNWFLINSIFGKINKYKSRWKFNEMDVYGWITSIYYFRVN